MMEDFDGGASDATDSEPDDYFDLDVDLLSDDWVPAGQAMRETVDLYLGVVGDRDRSVTDAIAAIRHRLETGALWARAARWSASLEYSGVEAELQDIMRGYSISEKEADVITASFWQNLTEAQKWENDPPETKWVSGWTRTDWIAGDIEFDIDTKVVKGPMKSMHMQGRATGLCFNRAGLPATKRLNDWIHHPQSTGKKAKGRPKGSGGWRDSDARIVEKMRDLIANNPEMTTHFAAGVYAGEASGSAELNTKQRRLWLRFRETYPCE
ncbi:hypothetical protein [Novosphingobium aquae]|uniref:Uncharacterized protein n=1 Tax=Novosphingobium aquae TaxID=3133435 RepID=A0ABU8S865_9SPHN